jgi:PAS domain-containing protein
MAHWLLIETFGPSTQAPTLIGFGTAARQGVALRNVVRNERALRLVLEAVARARHLTEADDRVLDGRRCVVQPLRTFHGTLHGAHVWIDAEQEPVPPRPPAGAWQFNLTTDKISGSPELLDLYGVPESERKTERSTAEAFGRLITNVDESAALAKIVRAEPGTEHRATWTVRRDDGQLRAAHFSCRALAEQDGAARHVVLRGITHDLGPAASTPGAPPPAVLAQRLLAGLGDAGTSRALVNTRTHRVIRWVENDRAPSWMAWQHEATDPVDHWIHPEDRPVLDRLVAAATGGAATATVRFRTTVRGWRGVPTTVHRVELDESTAAALVVLQHSAADPVSR